MICNSHFNLFTGLIFIYEWFIFFFIWVDLSFISMETSFRLERDKFKFVLLSGSSITCFWFTIYLLHLTFDAWRRKFFDFCIADRHFLTGFFFHFQLWFQSIWLAFVDVARGHGLTRANVFLQGFRWCFLCKMAMLNGTLWEGFAYVGMGILEIVIFFKMLHWLTRNLRCNQSLALITWLWLHSRCQNCPRPSRRVWSWC